MYDLFFFKNWLKVFFTKRKNMIGKKRKCKTLYSPSSQKQQQSNKFVAIKQKAALLIKEDLVGILNVFAGEFPGWDDFLPPESIETLLPLEDYMSDN